MRCVLLSYHFTFFPYILYNFMCFTTQKNTTTQQHQQQKQAFIHPHRNTHFHVLQPSKKMEKTSTLKKEEPSRKKINSIMLFVLTHHKTQTDYTLCWVQRAVCYTFCASVSPSFFSCLSRGKKKLLVVRRHQSQKSVAVALARQRR